MNVFYRNIRSFGSLYGTTIVYGGKYRPSLYEEQRFGINYTEKPSIIRKNFTTVKRITLGARPLTSVINMDKFGIIESRNQEEMNRTFDHQDFPKFNNDNKGKWAVVKTTHLKSWSFAKLNCLQYSMKILSFSK